jgi:feS assembly protein sufB
MKKKTNIEELDRGIYDIIEDVEISKKLDKGLTEEIVREISKEKDEPEWMLEIRLRALKKYNEKQNPNWGPELDTLNMDDIVTYIRPDAKKEASWDNVPEGIKNTFERLRNTICRKKIFSRCKCTV